MVSPHHSTDSPVFSCFFLRCPFPLRERWHFKRWVAWGPECGPSLRFPPPPAEPPPFLLSTAPGPHLGVQSPSSAGGYLLVTFGALPPLFSSATPPHSLSIHVASHPGSALICSFWPHVHIFEDFFCCLGFSENITCVGFLPPTPTLFFMAWGGKKRQ